MGRNVLLSGTQLERWADERSAQGMLPLLVRRLVLGTVDRIARIDFPAEDAVSRPGYDGFLQTLDGNAFVPAGQSMWEVSVNQDIAKKANKDYTARGADPGDVDPTTAIFVFLTPRRWKRKSAWAARKRKDKVWADVRAYDAEDLEQWLEIAPPVAAWFCRQIHGLPPGLQDMDEVWETWSARTNPVLRPELLLAGRAEAADRVRAWLNGRPAILSLHANSADEAIGFFAAFIDRCDELLRETYRSRSLVVTNSDAWRAVAGLATPLVLVSASATTGSAARAVARGHHVLLACGNEAATADAHVRLPPPRRDQLERALVSMGLTGDRAGRLARESKGQIAAVVELLGRGSPAGSPRWAAPGTARTLVPLLLAGAWSDSDNEVVCQLTGLSEQELCNVLAHWANEADPPLRRIASVWQWVARRGAWAHLSRFITAADMLAFQKTTMKVLGEVDPRLDMTLQDRWFAPGLNRGPRYSDLLREGLAEALVLLAMMGESVQADVDTIAFVQDIVADLLGRAPEGRRWCSLAPLLPILAEAAPDAFLLAVERHVVGAPSVAAALFEKEGMFSGARSIYLLSALEQLAWCPDYLSPSAVLLAALAVQDPTPGGCQSPSESLRAIFLPWKPHTSASLPARLAAIDAVARNHETVAFNLGLRLLPARHDSVGPAARPRWRDWCGDPVPYEPTDHQAAVQGIFERLLKWTEKDPIRWPRLLDPFPRVKTQQTEALVDALERLDVSGWGSADQQQLRRAPRRTIHFERSCGHVNPSLTQQHLERMERVYHALTPQDLVLRHAWLFDNRPEVLSVNRDDWAAEQTVVESERRAAIRDCLDTLGPDVIVRLADNVENPFWLGYFTGQSDLPDDRLADLVARCLDAEERSLRACGLGAVTGRHQKSGLPWVKGMVANGPIQRWPAKRRARFACGLPFDARTWDLIESWGEESVDHYWQETDPVTVDDVARDGPRALQNLVSHRRPIAALDLASVCLVRETDAKAVPASVLLHVLRAMAALPQANALAKRGHAIGVLLSAIEQSGIADESELVILEWQFLPVLRHTQRGLRMLERRLSRDPKLFAEAIRCLYRPRHEGQSEEDAESSIK